MSDSSSSSSGIGFVSLLAVLFIGLKLTNYIDWSWFWILAPIWIPLTILAAVFTAVGIMYLISKRW